MQILRYVCAEQRYKRIITECSLLGSGDCFWLDSETLEPTDSTIPVGEGFFVYNPGIPTSWTFEFHVE